MKGTIKIADDDSKKIYVAARIHGVKLLAKTSIGANQSLLEVDFRDPANLFEMGKTFTTVKGTEFDAQLKAEAEKAAAAAKKKA